MKFFVVFSQGHEKPEVGKEIELNWKSAPFYSFYHSLEAAVEHIRQMHEEYPSKDPSAQQYWIASGSISNEDALYCINSAVLSGGTQTVTFTPTSVHYFSNNCAFSVKIPEDPADLESNSCLACGMG